MCKYHLIPADYEYFNFKELQNELNNHDKKVCWSNSNDEGKYQHHFNENDIVYIYFHDSKKITNQILLRARVCKSDYNDNKHYFFSEYCKNELNNNKELSQEKRKEYLENSNKKIKGIYLTDFEVLNEYDKKIGNFRQIDQEGLYYINTSEEKIKLNIRVTQSKRILPNPTSKKDKCLVNYLENKFVKCDDLIEYFNNSLCDLCKNNNEFQNRTFIRKNGIYYFEGHHILQQNIMNKEDEKLSLIPKEIIKNKNKFVYSQFNLIKLCSLHHNQLHKGIESDRRYLLDKVMKKKNYINSVLNEYKNLSDEDINNLMTYIYSQYNLNYNESVN